MEMVKKNTAMFIATVDWFMGALFGSSFVSAIISGAIVGVLLAMFSTKITFKDDTNKNDTNKKGED